MGSKSNTQTSETIVTKTKLCYALLRFLTLLLFSLSLSVNFWLFDFSLAHFTETKSKGCSFSGNTYVCVPFLPVRVKFV
ncbi:hypothetical protein Q3G72_025503 [Acer saccharum]|nr:hypothetical protein Q3G72_025503 [Acer saccharum]